MPRIASRNGSHRNNGKKDARPDEKLRPYIFLGLDLNYRDGDKDAQIDCPMCNDTERKFGVKLATGQYNCFPCGAHGNTSQFVDWLWDTSYRNTKTADYEELAHERKLLYADTLVRWGVAKSILTNDWLIPGYNIKNEVIQLYRYMFIQEKGVLKKRLLPIPTLGHKMHGIYESSKPKVYVCEGPWDGMALWEILQHTKRVESTGGYRIVETVNEAQSQLSDTSVVACPGATSFPPAWLEMFGKKEVTLMFDNDHERQHPKTNEPIEGAGFVGTKRLAKLLLNAKSPPASVQYLKWGDNGFDPSLPSGTDVRDLLCQP